MTEIIAEIGWNFMGDMKLASKMIADAKEAGATTAKFQYWNPRKLKQGPWDEDGRKEIYLKAALDVEKILILKRVCEESSINFLISCFNKEDAQILLDIQESKIKIPSHEIANIGLHEFAAKNFEKVYVSAGAGTETEVEKAIMIYKEHSKDFVVMHCVSSYPCASDKANLSRLEWLKNFDVTLGYSDHTQSLVAPAIACSLGATVIEKHFTSDKNLPGRDNQFAVTKDELAHIKRLIDETSDLLINHGNSFLDIESDTIQNYRGRWG